MFRGFAALMLVSSAAQAAPPPDADPALHSWFETQHSIEGSWCCNVSDGHLLEDNDWRHSGYHYEVRVEGKWYPIPRAAMRDPHGGPNPTGHAIVWYSGEDTSLRIYCFTPGFEY